jgi:hypothetical protein
MSPNGKNFRFSSPNPIDKKVLVCPFDECSKFYTNVIFIFLL